MADQRTPTSAPEEPELDDRKTAILNAIVSEYIETAQPVGSGHLIKSPGVEVSSATVRSEMAALERDGYLTQPHTSAGRIPTDKGYRFFVDHLSSKGALDASERQEVRKFFAQVHGEVEDLLGRTSGLLTHLTDYAAVVVGPSHDSAAIRAVQLVSLSPKVCLLVLVLVDGTVAKRTLELSSEADDGVLSAAAAHLTALLQGSPLSQFPRVPRSPDDRVNALIPSAIDAIASIGATEEPDNIFVGGSSRMAAAFDAVDTVRSVLSILEQQLVVVELIEDVLDRGLSVAIGAEHGFEPLASCALVVGPYEVEGEPTGAIGVLGPTRMNYPKAMAAVSVVGAKLGQRLGRNRGDDDKSSRGG